MNTKTTLILAVLAALVASYVLLWDKSWRAPAPPEKPKPAAKEAFSAKPTPVGVDRVEIDRRDGSKLALIKKGEDWWIDQPIQAPAASHQVTSIIDKFSDLKYIARYPEGDKARPARTGLDQPVVVRLIKDARPVASLRVGSSLPTGRGSYIQIGDANGESKDVLESTTDLTDAFNTRLEELRDKNILKMSLADVKRVRVEGSRQFTLTQSDGKWLIEEPVRGRADKAKAEEVARPLTSLYVTEFGDNNPPSYRPYGLEPPRLKVMVDVEKTVPPKAKPGEAVTQPADSQPSTETTTHELHVGGPADAGNKQYFARLAGQPGVFTIAEYTFKQLVPELDALQDKQIATVDSGRIKSIRVEAGGAAATLAKAGGKWTFEDGSQADSAAVDDLLKSVRELKAEQFVDQSTQLVKTDWEKPRARVSITEEGSLNPVVVLVGDASSSGKMVYVRNAAEQAVAAVHEEAVAQLLAPPVSYRNRTIISFDRERASKLKIERAGAPTVVLAQQKGVWSMVEPLAGPVDGEAMRNLMQDLSSLQARRVVATTKPAEFGLDKPGAVLTVTIDPLTAQPNTVLVGSTTQPAASRPAAATKPAPATSTAPAGKTLAQRITQIEELLEFQKTNPQENPAATQMLRDKLAELKGQAASQPAEQGGSPATASAPAEQPTVFVVRLSSMDGKAYASIAGREMVYEVDPQVYTDAAGELHDRQITRFEVDRIVELAVGAAESPMTFRKSGEDWKYLGDLVLPIDKEKVTKVLNDVREIKTDRYVDYKAGDLKSYGLDQPALRLSLASSDGQRTSVLISATGPKDDQDKSRYAVVEGQNKVFLLKGEQVTKLDRKLDDFEKSASGESTPPPGGPGGPAGPGGPGGQGGSGFNFQ